MKKNRILVANRGEIAVRIIKACKELGIESVLACSEADKESMGAKRADKTVIIGPPQPDKSYLDISKIVNTAVENGCDAIHPGYGFLAENPDLPSLCEEKGIIFIGPRPQTMRQMGDKISARKAAVELNVPINEGSKGLTDSKEGEAIAEKIGYPVILKAAAGGGGRGMRIVQGKNNFKSEFDMASAEAQKAFGVPTLFVERYLQNARHVEVQVLGDNYGKLIHLGLRDCSSQRRYQKVIEEALPYNLPAELTDRISEAAVSLCQGINYNNAGTVEFLVDKDRNEFYFMEVNSRIQVEHPVTEEITGIDLVKEQIRIAYGDPLPIDQEDIEFKGHAIECRITAENTKDDFMPTPGRIKNFYVPNETYVRVDTHCYEGYLITPFYDSLLAKVITIGDTRDEALENMRKALSSFEVSGVETNIPFLQFLINQPEFGTGDITIKWIEDTVLTKFLEVIN